MQPGVRRRVCFNSQMESTTNRPIEAPRKRKGRRVEGLSDQDVVKHGHDARRRHLPIWTNPFRGPKAVLWRKGWRRTHDPDPA